jgi:hypothetical protein
MEKRRKTVTLNVRLTPELKSLMEVAARDDRRSMTQLFEKLLIDHLKATGRWPPPTSDKTNKRRTKD